MSRSGRSVRWRTPVATLPSVRRARPSRPWVAMAIRSQLSARDPRNGCRGATDLHAHRCSTLGALDSVRDQLEVLQLLTRRGLDQRLTYPQQQQLGVQRFGELGYGADGARGAGSGVEQNQARTADLGQRRGIGESALGQCRVVKGDDD